jgi:hypothetical protein
MHLEVTRRLLARAAAVAAAGLAVSAGLAMPASASSSPWTVVSTPNVRSADDETISGVAAISGSDVWAVGRDDDPGTVIGFQTANEQTDISQTLALRNTSG